MVLAQLLLRPIHVIRSGLTRLGRGEFGVRLDLNQQDEFGELGTFFNTVSAQLSADRIADGRSGGQPRVGGRAPRGRGRDRQPRRAAAVRESRDASADSRRGGRRVARARSSAGSSAAAAVGADAGQPAVARPDLGVALSVPAGEPGERLLLTHPVNDAKGELVGDHADRAQSRVSEPGAVDGAVLAQARRARTPVGRRRARGEEPAERDDDSPRAAAAAGRAAGAGRPSRRRAGVSAAVAAEAPPRRIPRRSQHVDVIAGEIRRLDEVVQGFLKFTRPEDLKLQPVVLSCSSTRWCRSCGPRPSAAASSSSSNATARSRSTAIRRCCARRSSIWR